MKIAISHLTPLICWEVAKENSTLILFIIPSGGFSVSQNDPALNHCIVMFGPGPCGCLGWRMQAQIHHRSYNGRLLHSGDRVFLRSPTVDCDRSHNRDHFYN
ncbi:uncharacterized protein FSUBG_3748 [Fusarium subglutinans]|uniref:Uncharacterized protein n=1 Tax=Gibberella subglutinans TaxID=42677 RepID=A0A8H5V401_GIBSU|nr:uncharacterized protein FSUBG_3748 [Fusarium subglutinans]KAF5609751.1 hypothetical protein FSUBG_3748 [Fusarium subglutinans]